MSFSLRKRSWRGLGAGLAASGLLFLGPALQPGQSLAQEVPACRESSRPLAARQRLWIESGNGSVEVWAEVARTANERRDGLMCRPALASRAGMLFVYGNSAVRRIWMKNTLIPLDILFLNGEGGIEDWVVSAPPCRTRECPIFTSKSAAAYVLELPGGFMRAHQLDANSKVRLAP